MDPDSSTAPAIGSYPSLTVGRVLESTLTIFTISQAFSDFVKELFGIVISIFRKRQRSALKYQYPSRGLGVLQLFVSF